MRQLFTSSRSFAATIIAHTTNRVTSSTWESLVTTSHQQLPLCRAPALQHARRTERRSLVDRRWSIQQGYEPKPPWLTRSTRLISIPGDSYRSARRRVRCLQGPSPPTSEPPPKFVAAASSLPASSPLHHVWLYGVWSCRHTSVSVSSTHTRRGSCCCDRSAFVTDYVRAKPQSIASTGITGSRRDLWRAHRQDRIT